MQMQLCVLFCLLSSLKGIRSHKYLLDHPMETASSDKVPDDHSKSSKLENVNLEKGKIKVNVIPELEQNHEKSLELDSKPSEKAVLGLDKSEDSDMEQKLLVIAEEDGNKTAKLMQSSKAKVSGKRESTKVVDEELDLYKTANKSESRKSDKNHTEGAEFKTGNDTDSSKFLFNDEVSSKVDMSDDEYDDSKPKSGSKKTSSTSSKAKLEVSRPKSQPKSRDKDPTSKFSQVKSKTRDSKPQTLSSNLDLNSETSYRRRKDHIPKDQFKIFQDDSGDGEGSTDTEYRDDFDSPRDLDVDDYETGGGRTVRRMDKKDMTKACKEQYGSGVLPAPEKGLKCYFKCVRKSGAIYQPDGVDCSITKMGVCVKGKCFDKKVYNFCKTFNHKIVAAYPDRCKHICIFEKNIQSFRFLGDGTSCDVFGLRTCINGKCRLKIPEKEKSVDEVQSFID